jgi:hypothetical protein
MNRNPFRSPMAALPRVLIPAVTLAAAVLLWPGVGAQTVSPFSDETAAQGVTFTHQGISGDKLRMGAGAAWGDFNGDGALDLYVATQVGPNSLFQNLGGGAGFVDVAAQLGVDDPGGQGTGALWGDYDNDGDADLFVMNRGDSVMYRNDGPGGPGGWIFTDVTAELGLAAFGRTAAAVYGDYDNDGWLDLYVANHGYYPRYPQPGDDLRSDYLFRNTAAPDGSRTFVNVAPQLFPENVLANTLAHSVGFFDYDNDGDLDIYVVNEVMGTDDTLLGNILWRNDGPGGPAGWIFTDATLAAKLTLRSNPMGLSIGDINNDGWWDIAMSDVGPNTLFQNHFGVFTERAKAAGVQRTKIPGTSTKQISWGMLFLDFDFDGFEDLYVAAGELSISSLKQQPNALFRNDRNPPNITFTDVTAGSGADDPLRSRTAIKGDYDGDGDEDIYVVNYGQPAHLFRNDQIGGDYLVLKLTGTVSNRDAIGARVRLSWTGGPDQYRMVQSGSTTGGSNELALFFGVPGAATVDTVTIDWPSGLNTVLSDVPTRQRLTVIEPAGAQPSIISVAGVSVAEPDDGTTSARFVVHVRPATLSEVRIDYTTVDGTAAAGTDYMPTSGTLIIPPRSTQAAIDVPIIGDLVDESTVETFFLELSNPVNAFLGTASAEGQIRDNDGLLFEDNFADGVVSWSVEGGTWSEDGGALVVGTPSGTARAVAPLPWFPSGDSSCLLCTLEATVTTAGGVKNKVALVGWHRDWSNYVELAMEQDANRWVLAQIVGGTTVARKVFGQTLVPNVNYAARLSFDGINLHVAIDGVPIMSLPVSGMVAGNVGLRVSKTTGTFRNVRLF